MKHRFI